MESNQSHAMHTVLRRAVRAPLSGPRSTCKNDRRKAYSQAGVHLIRQNRDHSRAQPGMHRSTSRKTFTAVFLGRSKTVCPQARNLDTFPTVGREGVFFIQTIAIIASVSIITTTVGRRVSDRARRILDSNKSAKRTMDTAKCAGTQESSKRATQWCEESIQGG